MKKAPQVTQRRGVVLKSRREIGLMRQAGAVVHSVLTRVRELAVVGVTTAELNAVAEKMIADADGIALFKGVENPQADKPFPAALCTSVNEELVHGVPGDRALVDGDIVSVDCGVRLNGYCGDSATTIAVGSLSARVTHLLDVTRGALALAIEKMRPGLMWSEVAAQMQEYVEAQGLSVVREFVGHGIGREMHEEPKVPNYWDKAQRRLDFELVPGLVLAVEPMVNLGSRDVDFAGPGRWPVVTKDGQPAAHFEHTLAVTETGVEILTDGK